MSNGWFAGLGKLLDAGAAYVQHAQFAEAALGSTPQQATALLKHYAAGLSDAGFAGLKVTLAMLVGNEADPARRAGLQQLLEATDAARTGQPVSVPLAPAAVAQDDFEADLARCSRWHDELDEESRGEALVEHVRSLDAAGYERFAAHLAQMREHCAERIRQHEADEGSAWGGSVEDRMAYRMASLRSGQRDPGWLRQMQEIQHYQTYFDWLGRTAALVRSEGERADAEPAAGPDKAAVLAAVRAFTTSGQYPGGVDRLKSDLEALIQRGEADEVMALLESVGGKEGGRKLLDSDEHYRPGEGAYQLRWPLDYPLPLPFEELDRRMQFKVLFSEWIRREMEGRYALQQGDLEGARATFDECLARAGQLDVPELAARSHEGLASVAGRANQRAEERRQLKAAIAARGRSG